MPVFNLSAYKFNALEDLPALRERLRRITAASGLKGTILLSPEGINLFVAGDRAAVAGLMDELGGVSGLEGLAPKESVSDEQPFNRMLVKIKKEIIAFGVEGIDPARKPTAKLPPAALKQWLDEGRPVTLLDTRNNYEVRMGTFRGALAAGIEHFREFPDAVERLSPDLKEQPVVMFCTGGIRCEKAGPFLEREGFKHVFQLEGGILKYFAECGGAHYDGECFVFDQRVGVDAALQETDSVLCFNCQMPLTGEEQRHPHYVYEKSCPHCFGRDGRSAPREE
ncbi:MAG: rhodanese-like domain-containing protein [Opitutaceae bacterium]